MYDKQRVVVICNQFNLKKGEKPLYKIVETTIPEVELLYKYRIPFYYYKKRPLCFLNASHKKQFVDICFVRGNQITIHQDLLVTEKRKVMASLRYKSVEEINDVALIAVLKNVLKLY